MTYSGLGSHALWLRLKNKKMQIEFLGDVLKYIRRLHPAVNACSFIKSQILKQHHVFSTIEPSFTLF